MFVPDQVRKSVAYVGYKDVSGETIVKGTAFFAGREVAGMGLFPNLITARHLIKKIQTKEDFRGEIIITVNPKQGDKPIDWPTMPEDWLFHPEDEQIDVAVLPGVHRLANKGDIVAIPLTRFLNEELRIEHEISIGDELFLTGLFYSHRGRSRNIPIVRVGNLATMLEEKVKTETMGFIDAYLIEARSIGGLSGSPVFVTVENRLPKNSIPKGTGNREKKNFFLLGLMHGHFEIDLLGDAQGSQDALTVAEEVVNMGIAIVIPSEKILEVLEQPKIRDPEIEYLNHYLASSPGN